MELETPLDGGDTKAPNRSEPPEGICYLGEGGPRDGVALRAAPWPVNRPLELVVGEQLPPRRNQPPWWGAGQSPSMKGQPVETQIASMRPRLEEEVWARWKSHWRSHRQQEEVHEPRTLRPVLGDEGEEGPVRHPKLRQHLGKNGPRRKSVRQETVPGLEERVHPCRERVSVGREIDGAAVIVGSGRQVDHHRPLTLQRSKDVHVERPFGTGELVRTGERVRENIADPRNELRSQSNPKRFHPTEDPLGNGVESRRPGAPPPCIDRGPWWHCRKTRPPWSLINTGKFGFHKETTNVSTKSGTEVLTLCHQKEEWQVWVCDGGTLSEWECTKGKWAVS